MAINREQYRTIAAGYEATGEFEDRRSRFIAQVTSVQSEHEAQAFIEKVRSRHRDARHNVPAWILSDGRERCSDDGEPSHILVGAELVRRAEVFVCGYNSTISEAGHKDG